MSGLSIDVSLRQTESGTLNGRYNAVPPFGSRTRRKFVRLFTGSASCRRINSTSARSLSQRSASRCVSSAFFLFTQRPPQHREHGQILLASRSFLALDNVSQRGNANLVITEFDDHRAATQ